MNAALRLFLAFAPLCVASAQAQNFGAPAPHPPLGGQMGQIASPPSPGGYLGHGVFGRPPGSGYAGYGGYGSYGAPGAGYGGGYNNGGNAGVDGAGQGWGGCIGCSYIGDYNPNNGAPSTPAMAPAKRIQGQWRNGLWYY